MHSAPLALTGLAHLKYPLASALLSALDAQQADPVSGRTWLYVYLTGAIDDERQDSYRIPSALHPVGVR